MGLYGFIWWINFGFFFMFFCNKIKYKMYWMSLLYIYIVLKRVLFLVIENMYMCKELIMVFIKEMRLGFLNEEL